MTAASDGKAFERRFRESALRAGLAVVRLSDKRGYNPATGASFGRDSEADFLLFSPAGHAYMVECKSTRAGYLRKDALRGHQREALAAFDALHPRFHGVVAVEFLGETARRRRMFVADWGSLSQVGGRWDPCSLGAAGREFPKVSTCYGLSMDAWEPRREVEGR